MPIGPVLHALERQQEAQEEAKALRQEVATHRAAAQELDCTYGDTVEAIHCPLDRPCLTHQVERLKATVRALSADLHSIARRQRDACAVHLSGCGYNRGVVQECEGTPLVEVEE